MLVYKGVASQGYIQPRDLAKFDIVITTYETLSRELNYVDLPHSNSQLGRRYAFSCNFCCSLTSLMYCGYTVQIDVLHLQQLEHFIITILILYNQYSN